MSRRIRVRRYTKPAMILHWVAAIGIFALFAHGLWIVRIPGYERSIALEWHRSAGVAVLLCVLFRIWWRATHPPPRSLRMPKWQDRLAHFTHVWLYVLVVANGISGVFGWLFGGDPIVFFGLPVPPLTVTDAAAHRLCHIVSFATSRALAITILVHIAAALKHQFVDRDRLLARMWVSFTQIEYPLVANRDPRYSARRAKAATPRQATARRAQRTANDGDPGSRSSLARQVVIWERNGRANPSPTVGSRRAGANDDHARTIQGLRDRFASFAAGPARTSGAT